MDNLLKDHRYPPRGKSGKEKSQSHPRKNLGKKKGQKQFMDCHGQRTIRRAGRLEELVGSREGEAWRAKTAECGAGSSSRWRRKATATGKRQLLAGGGDGDAEFFEFGAGEAVFVAAGVALDDFAEFADAGGFLAEFDEGQAFAEVGGAELETFGIVGEDFFVGGDGFVVLLLLVGDFAEIKLSVGGEIGVAVIPEVILKFRVGKLVFAAGDVAETVGIESVGGGCAGGKRGGGGRGDGTVTGGPHRGQGRGGCGCASGRSGRAPGNFGVETLDGVLKIDELLVEFAETRLDFLEIVGEPLDLRGHGVKARAGISLHVLDGFLERAHGSAELADIVAGLLDKGLHDGVILDGFVGKILLALKQGGDVALKIEDFTGDGLGGPRPEKASSKRTKENGGAKNSDVADTHEHSS